MRDTNGTSDSKRTVVVHSSFSERLTRINIDFFKEAYALICSKYLKYVPDAVLDDMQIIRVDSTMVAETSNKLVEGFSTGMTKIHLQTGDNSSTPWLITDSTLWRPMSLQKGHILPTMPR